MREASVEESCRGDAAGYSLIELLVTLVVAAILAAVVAPSFAEVWRQQRLNGHVTELANAHRLARSASASRGKIVTVCKSADSTSSTPTCGDGTVAWRDGWVVFQNTDGDAPAAIDPGEPLLRVAPALPSGYTLEASASLDAHTSYRPTGDVLASGTLVLCRNDSLRHARALLVSTIGRIRVAERDADGVPLDDSGTAIDSCTPP